MSIVPSFLTSRKQILVIFLLGSLAFSYTIKGTGEDFYPINLSNVSDLQIVWTTKLESIHGSIDTRSSIRWNNENLLTMIKGSNSIYVVHPFTDETIDELCATNERLWLMQIYEGNLYCLDLANQIRVIDINQQTTIYSHVFNSNWVITSFVVNPWNGHVILNYFDSSSERSLHQVSIWTNDLSEEQMSFSSYSSGLWQLSIDPTGELLVLLGEQTPKIYGFSSGFSSIEFVTELEDISFANSALFNLDGSVMAIDGGSDQNDTVYRTAFLYTIASSPELLWTFTDIEIKPFAFTINNDLLIVGIGPLNEDLALIDITDIASNDNIVIRPALQEEEYTTFSNIVDIDLSDDGRFIATLHDDATINVWGIPCEKDCQ